MSDRFTNLRFIIGLFFVMMALIVLMGYIMSLTQHKSINL
jgi:hypothetical protein